MFVSLDGFSSLTLTQTSQDEREIPMQGDFESLSRPRAELSFDKSNGSYLLT